MLSVDKIKHKLSLALKEDCIISVEEDNNECVVNLKNIYLPDWFDTDGFIHRNQEVYISFHIKEDGTTYFMEIDPMTPTCSWAYLLQWAYGGDGSYLDVLDEFALDLEIKEMKGDILSGYYFPCFGIPMKYDDCIL